MKALLVQNGDLQLDSGGRLQFVAGSAKLVQDLTLWLQEEFGIGFTTPNFGSSLDSLIGGASNESVLALVQAEVQRVISLYQSQQLLSLSVAQSNSQLANWNKSEIINTINAITVSQNYNAIIVAVLLTTLADTSVNINITLDTNGIQVQ